MVKIVKSTLDDFFSLCYNNKNTAKAFIKLYIFAVA